jgi:D-lactate dehydrogenase
VELADRPALRSVQGKPGLPAGIEDLGPDGAAILVETRAANPVDLARQIQEIVQRLGPLATAQPIAFTTDPAETARYWGVRKGMFPSVGAVRKVGTTVVIEDVAFPVSRLAEAEAIIFGHALEGNLHFVFTQGFGDPAEVDRYRRFMDAVCRMVVEKYDGSLKAEHGTGRNIAPFVELEWGAEAYHLMRALKGLFDPQHLLNPGVILNDDRQAHLRHLKPMPACDPIVDKCIECGFCEPKCPSRGLTLSPRQRIVGWREIARLERSGASADSVRAMGDLYDYHGIDTCAACGLCATACPVGIETGQLILSLRRRSASPLDKKIAQSIADNFGAVTTGLRLGLGTADTLHGVVGTRFMQRTADGLRRVSGGRLPKWSPALPRPVRFEPRRQTSGSGDGERVVYFPSCVTRNMGTQRGDDIHEALPVVAERLFRKAGFDVVYPVRLGQLCCGQPFESKGLSEVADAKSAELEASLKEASDGGCHAIVSDTSPCAYRMKRYLQGRLPVLDSIEFLHDHVTPRLDFVARAEPIAVHPVCSVRKMGIVERLTRLAALCSSQVVHLDDVLCCGFAGDKGFNRPELNEHALRNLKASLPSNCQAGCSSSRTCEIGLSEAAGFPFHSIIRTVDACSRTPGAAGRDP